MPRLHSHLTPGLTMPLRLRLRSTISRYIVRPPHATSSPCTRSLLPVTRQLSHTRGLRTSQALHIEGLFGVLAALFEHPSVPESTVLEPPGDSHPELHTERAAFGLTGLARVAQNSRKRSPTITTLSPERLTAADIIHIPSNAETFTVAFKPPLEPSSTTSASSITPTVAPTTLLAPTPTATTPPGFVPRTTHASTTNASRQPRVPHEVTLRATSRKSILGRIPFPTSLACLYYDAPAAPCTPLAGALRLRILPALSGDQDTWTDQAVRAAFAAGHDFCVHTGFPWHVPLLTLVPGPERGRRDTYGAVRAMLLREQLVAQNVMDDAEREGRRRDLRRCWTRVISKFGQPFVVNLGATHAVFCFVGQDMVRSHTVSNLCSWNDPSPAADEREVPQPFKGRLVCAFERSKEPKDAGKPIVRIRVLEVLSPVERNPRYSGPQNIPLPHAKNLLARGVNRGTHAPWRRGWMPWRANIREVFKGMQALFENDPEGMPGKKSDEK